MEDRMAMGTNQDGLQSQLVIAVVGRVVTDGVQAESKHSLQDLLSHE